MNASIILQARMGSTRLPGKVLLKVMGKPILEYLIERLKKAKRIDGIIVATTTKEKDLRIAQTARKAKVDVFRGSEDDVLDRYYQAAKKFGVKDIVRITADCPLIDPEIIDDVVNCYFESKADFCCNVLKITFPDGEDAEVFSFDILKEAWKNANLASEREHVTPYIYKYHDKFKLVNFRNKIDLSDKRWTLDRKEDFEFIKIIFESLYPKNPDFRMDDILKFLMSNPQVEAINNGIMPNESYPKSLRLEDKVVNIDRTED